MSNISVIVPINQLTEKLTKFLDNAILSIANQTEKPKEVLFVHPEDVKLDALSNLNKIEGLYKSVINKGETDFCSQINLGVEESTGEFFSILEVDDEYSKIWFKNVHSYQEEVPNADVYLPITVEMREDGSFIDLTNQPVWAQGFNELSEMGFLEHNKLLEYPNFSISGAVIKKNTFQEIGGLKPSMKLTFVYEFLLRLTFNNGVVMTIPRIGYRHLRERQDGLLVTTLSDMNELERKWWLDKAKKEFYFNNDREIRYEE